jgi:hypothetical protein
MNTQQAEIEAIAAGHGVVTNATRGRARHDLVVGGLLNAVETLKRIANNSTFR